MTTAKSRRTERGDIPERRVGLALAGGGPLGAIYEIGATAALAEALEGIDFNALDVYVGVSSGGFIAAGLANGITPRQMAAMFIESESADEPFHPQILLKPAFLEFLERTLAIPGLMLGGALRYLGDPFGPNLIESFLRVSHAIPTGVFDNHAIDAFLRRLFEKEGRTNDFRRLQHKLCLVATDLDSGEAVEFGAPGWDHVPISTAVQASAALPGLFPPVEIDGHSFVDGALKKTLHASVALDYGASLLLCVNPLVPFDADLAARRGHPSKHRLVEGGLPLVLSQTFRAIIHSRMQVGMGHYARQYPKADVVLFEPSRDDAEMFFTNVFSYASRRRLSEHAYQKTRSALYRRRHELGPVLARHGIRIREDVLADPERHLTAVDAASGQCPRNDGTVATLARCLADLERWIDERLGPAETRRPSAR